MLTFDSYYELKSDIILQIDEINNNILKILTNNFSENFSFINDLIEKWVLITSGIDLYKINFNDNDLNESIKKFFVYELIFFSILYKQNLDNYLICSTFKNCSFYIQQSFMAIIFTLQEIIKFKFIDEPEIKELIKFNKIWLNKKNYRSYLKFNNKKIHQILSGLIKYIHLLNIGI